MFLLIMGICIMAYGYHTFKDPDSFWVRLDRRLPEDFVQDDDDLLKTKIRAAAGGIVGFIMALAGVFRLF